MYLKIKNYKSVANNACDYKGLDIDKFVYASQYRNDEEKYCIVQTNEEDIPSHPEIIAITELEYNNYKNIINNLPSQPNEIDLLKIENLNLQIALAETIEKQEQERVANQLAMAELIETLTMKGVL